MKKILFLLTFILTVSLSGRAVTFNVRVPAGTQKCFVCGAFNSWNVDAAPELTASGDNLFTLTLDEVTSVSGGFKYLCGRSWDYVEKDANGGEISDRTTLGNPDVVGSWRGVPEYSIESEEITVNGLPRLLKVYLPAGYEETVESYPVIYYNTVQQRFNKAGDDGDPGDYFFGGLSWNAQSTMESLREQDGKAYIMVQICSFLAENTPDANDEFIGTGQAETYLNAFVTELMPFVEGKWRTKKGASSTTIVGADYGALFSLYAALERPDQFGTCVAMSPMLWINPGAIESRASQAQAGQKFYVSTGSLEPSWMGSDARDLVDALDNSAATVYYTQFAGARHTDEDWGRNFGTILHAINRGTEPAASAPRKAAGAEFENAVYTLYGGTDQSNLQLVGPLTFTNDYCNGKTVTPSAAQVITVVIPASNKSKYYWNIARGTDSSDGWVMSDPKNVSFSSKKNADSWLNIGLMEDESIVNNAAHSQGFTLVNGTESTKMTTVEPYLCRATVSFPTSEKTFNIHFGSVNSASDMGAISGTYSVGENCIEAIVSYDFNLNKVTIEETKQGESEEEPEFKDQHFALYGGLNQDALEFVGNLTYTTGFCKKGSSTPAEAFVLTHTVPASVIGTYYYNISKGTGDNATWLYSSVKNVNYKTSKTEDSWQNVAVFPDGSNSEVSAQSKAFRVYAGSEQITMTQGSGYTSTAVVRFPGNQKSFSIHYGSVNTATDMGALTPELSVSADCVEAHISYDFNLNKVTVNETAFGESLDNIKVTSFTALPSVCETLTPVVVKLSLSEACTVDFVCKRNFVETMTVPVTQTSPTSYELNLNAPAEGIYTFTVSLSKGSNSMPNAAEINVRVLPAGQTFAGVLTVNAYDGINWDNIGRYKSNFHTHTTQSFDANFSTSETVDKYRQAGYTILALTDHDANSYPWNIFSLYNDQAQDRDPQALGMLAIPGNELSKDRRNSWSEITGGEFNHHNDLFTGRKGQEFMSLRESYAYTQALGGMQIINHPGQYWNLSNTYRAGDKNSPEWHAENFRLYNSLIGLEVYNQGNRRPNDRILWDQILTINMPDTPVWGYSCDDTHNIDQFFRNYQFMLMDELSVDALKDAMRKGATVFSYEAGGSGQDLAPHVKSISVDSDNHTISIDSDDADRIEWIYSTHRTNSSAPSSTKSTIVGLGKTFNYSGYHGSYVRARLVNDHGETATQPFGFSLVSTTTPLIEKESAQSMLKVDNDTQSHIVSVSCSEPMLGLSVVNVAGMVVRYIDNRCDTSITFSSADMAPGVYVMVAATDHAAYTAKIVIK